MHRLKTIFTRLISWGQSKTHDQNERKRVKLLNIFCVSWLLMEAVLMIEDSITKDDPTLQLLIHTGTVVGLISVAFLQRSGRFTAARILFFSLILYSNFLFCNFAERGNYIEYFYIMIPALMLLFTDKQVILIPTFIISILLFFIPNRVFDIYPKGTFGSPIIILVQFGFIFYLVKYFKDANKKSEQELEAKKNELEQLNEFQLQFFTNIAHEIRTPLTIINGEADKIVNNKGIKKQVSAINNIVNDVLDLSKLKDTNFELNMQYVNLQELVFQTYTAFEPLATQKEIDMSLNLDNNITIQADKLFLQRAINNLVNNAIKYTPRKGSITIESSQDENAAILSVSDTGIGISPKNIDLVFNRFYQVNNDINKAGGSGIGLNFSKEIIALHDGSLSVESKLEEGSVFTIRLPICTDVEVESVPAIEQVSVIHTSEDDDQQSVDIEKKSHTLLIVDDNYEMREYVQSLLDGYTCHEAENGQDALQFLAKNEVDLVITDYMMPTMNGLDLLKNIKSKKLNIPVIMLTAATNKDYLLESLRLGVDDYLNKPFEREELLVRIENVLKNYASRTIAVEEEKENITTEDPNENTEWVKVAKDYIYSNCRNINLTQIDLATHLNTSRSSLNRKIKIETGLTPNQFIKEVKLLKAREIVEHNPQVLLKTLAMEVGYMNPSYFSKIYKDRFGCMPA